MNELENEKHELQIAQDIIRVLSGDFTKPNDLIKWFEAHPTARKLLTDADLLSKEFMSIEPEQKKQSIIRFRKQIHLYKRKKFIRRLTVISTTAAAIILIGIFMFKQTDFRSRNEYQPLTYHTMIKDSVPTLIFSSGEKMDMTKFAIKQQTIDIATVMANGTLSHAASLNTYKVPPMYTSRIALPDSTIVYLNSDSEISFPSQFLDSIRQVTIRGEAYFNVAHSKTPFVVKVNDAEIKVYGTKFNIKAYPENNLQAVLVEGSIGIKYQGTKTMMVPNELCVINYTDGKIKQETVSTAKYIAWTEGIFMFERDYLQDIVSELSRWYGVKIDIENHDLLSHTLTAFFERTSPIEEIFATIAQTLNANIIKEERRYVIR
ncbi:MULTISPECIES: FecR family protein [Butyricimonas]|uniref:FecR family protein n=1 Tax=Butyricimonas TaxID=574697 RepID=UPI0007FB331D|nr:MULTISPECIES: FecR family protein [Butyricimonas]